MIQMNSLFLNLSNFKITHWSTPYTNFRRTRMSIAICLKMEIIMSTICRRRNMKLMRKKKIKKNLAFLQRSSAQTISQRISISLLDYNVFISLINHSHSGTCLSQTQQKTAPKGSSPIKSTNPYTGSASLSSNSKFTLHSCQLNRTLELFLIFH